MDSLLAFKSVRKQEGVTNAIRLLTEIQQQGYPGGYTLVRQFVQVHRPEAKPVATVRFETKPGEQAQVDFGVFLPLA